MRGAAGGRRRGDATPTISVVICSYTMARWSQLEAAVSSVLNQSERAIEVVLAIDHCSELESRARARFGDDVQVVPNRGRRGLSGARNSGVSATSGEVVVFLDDDARAEPGWLAAHASSYRTPDVIGVGGLVLPSWAGDAPRWFPPEFGWVVGCSYTGQPMQTAEVRNPIGANMSFRRSALEAAGGFSEELGRVGSHPVGCEETELSIRIARLVPSSRILHEPTAVVRHDVPASRMRFTYFRQRCWAEGLSKAKVARLSDPRRALASERGYVLRTLPKGLRRDLVDTVADRDASRLARAAVLCAGLAVTATAYASERAHAATAQDRQPEEGTVPDTRTRSGWTYFNVHDRIGIRVQADAPAAAQLRTMLACFASEGEVPADIVVSTGFEAVADAAELEDQLSYTEHTVAFSQEKVQIVRDGSQIRIHGSGELLTTLVPVLDRLMVERGAGMIHAATVGYRGHGLAMPAGGGTGKTSTVAKLMKRDGYSFMGDDWAFLADDKSLLGFEKPMFIRPHHRTIYPHLFAGARKPMIPSSMSRPVGRLVTRVHPFVIRFPRLADVARRWSPEHRMVDAATALPGVPVTEAAPLLVCIYLERFGGAESRLVEVDEEWMVDRMMGNFHIEMAGFSQETVTALAATSVIPWRQHVIEKGDVLRKALEGISCHLLQVPSAWSADQASDDVVRHVEALLPTLLSGVAASP